MAWLQVLDQTDQDQGLEERPKANNQSQVSNRSRKEGPKFHSSTSTTVFYSSFSNLTRLFQDSVNEPITPGSERWKVGPGFIEVKDLVLVKLVHVSKGSWQAEFRATE